MMRFRFWRSVLGAAALAFVLVRSSSAEPPQNVILMVGDGMGLEHMKAAGLQAHGRAGSLFMESLPHRAQVVTCSAYAVPSNQTAAAVAPKVTDSAAAATAMATGHKVYNGVLSVALPGDGQPLRTILEAQAAAGKRTGLITTSFLTDATPAGFAAHVKLRNMQKDIAEHYLNRSRPNLLLGGANKEKNVPLTPAGGRAASYVVATNRATLAALVADSRNTHLLGLFGEGPMCYEYDYAHTTRKDYDHVPHLSEMAAAALEFLAREPKGFFAMIEGACIDKASHKNELERAVDEVLEFDKTVRLVVTWARARGDTLVVVTADHETGGLQVVAGNAAGGMPKVTWAGKGHSGANVGLFACGPGSEKVEGLLDNTDVFRLLEGTFTAPSRYVPVAAPAGEVPKAPKDND